MSRAKLARRKYLGIGIERAIEHFARGCYDPQPDDLGRDTAERRSGAVRAGRDGAGDGLDVDVPLIFQGQTMRGQLLAQGVNLRAGQIAALPAEVSAHSTPASRSSDSKRSSLAQSGVNECPVPATRTTCDAAPARRTIVTTSCSLAG